MLDPVTFQRKFLPRRLWAKQQELVRAIRTHNQIAVKGCHGSGKTYACAGMVPYEVTGHQESIVLVTAPTLRQVKTFWREITEVITTSQIRFPAQNQRIPQPPSSANGASLTVELLHHLEAIKSAALSDDYAYRQLAHLTENIGPRPAGSAAANAAVEYVAAQMRELGLDVH